MPTRTSYTTGDVVDERYAIIELIGSGGMAHVYRAHDEVLDRDVALKVLHAHFASDEQFVQRFQREARAAARLSHPNLVPIYDSGAVDDTFYIAMELVAGETLFDQLRREGHLSEATLVPPADQALAAVAYAHARGVVHRDLKPANLIIGDNDRLRVADFGIAHIATDATVTLAGSISGTPQYLSPEQARGEPTTAASDLYSLGIVMYEALVGAPPFTGDSAVAVAVQHLHGNIPSVNEGATRASAAVAAAIAKATAVAPEERFATAAEFRAALQGDDGAATAVLATAAATAVLAGGVAGEETPTTILEPQSETHLIEPDDAPFAPRRRRLVAVLMLCILLALVGALLFLQQQSPTAGNADSSKATASSSTSATTAPNAAPLATSTKPQMPNFVGMTAAEAAQAAIVADVQPRYELALPEEGNQNVQTGSVFRQDPPAGATIAPGGDVTLTLAAASPGRFDKHGKSSQSKPGKHGD